MSANHLAPLPAAEQEELLAFAGTLADTAGALILPHFRARHDIADKSVGRAAFDPVTEADRNAEQAMRDMIARRYPGDGIQGEEYDNITGTSRRDWVLDPIDGTRSFIIGVPLWGTLIGLTVDGRPAIGLMDQSYLGERYIGAGGRAVLRKAGDPDQELKTGTRTRLGDAFLGTTDPNLFAPGTERDAFQRLSEGVRLARYGGDCYFYCQLASGHLDLVVESGLGRHDILPLIPIIRGAGGVVTDWSGSPEISHGQVLAAANPDIHASALEVLNA